MKVRRPDTSTAVDLMKVQAPTKDQEREATVAARILRPVLSGAGKKAGTTLSVRSAGTNAEEVTIPKRAFELLVSILEQMSLGNAVTILPIHAELTTQEAANLLNVSRPFLVKLLDSGAIPFRMVGTHRRVLANDLRAYQVRDLAERAKAATELTEEAEALGLGY